MRAGIHFHGKLLGIGRYIDDNDYISLDIEVSEKTYEILKALGMEIPINGMTHTVKLEVEVTIAHD